MSVSTAATPAMRKRSSWEIQRAVLYALVLREIRTRVGRHWSGIVWTLFEPLLHVLVIVLVFGYLRHIASPIMEFPVFLVSGLMPFFLFRNLAQRLTDAIDANRGLFSYRQVKPADTVLARGAVECLTWLAVMVLTLAVLQWMGLQAVPRQPLELFAVAAIIALLGGSLGLLLAVVTHGRPRVRMVARMIYMPLYLLSGVIFSIDRLPPELISWLRFNPLLHLIDLSRNAFDPRHLLHQGVGWAYPSMFTLVLLALALALYWRDRQKFLISR